MFWEHNRQAILAAHPKQQALLEQLHATSPTTQVELVSTTDDDFTLLYRDIPLHALSGALTEAQQVARQHCKPRLGRAHLVIGMGLGYLMEAVYQRSPGQIVVYEPDLPLLKFVLTNVDLTEYFNSGRVQLAATPAQLLNILSPLVACEDPLDILMTPGYATLMSTEVPSLMDQLFALVDERVRDYQTGKHFHFQWIHQFFQNLPAVPNTLRFDDWAGRLAQQPALIMGRGPSLDAAIETIQALSDSMTLIAVGGALHRLYAAEIIPHFAVFYDAKGMQEQLHGLPAPYLEQIIFLVSAFTEPCCFVAPAKAKILFFPKSGEALAQWLYPYQADLPSSPSVSDTATPLLLEGGGTVSLIALQAALAMGCDPVVLIGQDLAFPNNQVYAGGIPLQTDAQGRMALPKTETLYTAPEAMTQVGGQTGETLPALKAYAGFIRHFERMAEANAQSAHPVRLINASIGGAQLNGYELMALDQFQATDVAAHPQTDRLNIPALHAQTDPNRLAENLRMGLTQLRHTLSEAMQLYKTALESTQSQTAEQTRQKLFTLLNEHPLIAHTLMFEMMETQQQYNPNASTDEEIAQNQAVLKHSLQSCLDVLQNQLAPCVLEAESTLLKPQDSSATTLTEKKMSPSFLQ